MSLAGKEFTKKKNVFLITTGKESKQWLFYPEHETELEFKHWLTKISESSTEFVGEEIVNFSNRYFDVI